MSKSKSSISKAESYKEIGEFWDTRGLADYWEQTHPVEFEVDIQFEVLCHRCNSRRSERGGRRDEEQCFS